MRRLIFVILAVLVVALAAWMLNAQLRAPAPAGNAVATASPTGPIPWRHDYSVAVEEARRDHKPIFLYFSAVWCKPCQDMKTTTWSDSQVATALQAYEPVELDINQNPTVAAKFNATDLPAFFVVDPATGQVQRTHPGALSPEDFVRWLKG